MKYAIISDLHANMEALEAVLARIEQIGVDQIVCLGDVVGYNACPNECVDLISQQGIPTICGNHDAVACGLDEPWGFNPVALAAALWTREALTDENAEWLKTLPDTLEFEAFLAAHGAPSDRDIYLFTWEDVLPHLQRIEEMGHSVCFFGHTHNPGIFARDGVFTADEDPGFHIDEGKCFLINPGSVGQPRDGDPRAAFGLLDTGTNLYKMIRVDYPIKEAAERIIAAGLPEILAERLFLGR